MRKKSREVPHSAFACKYCRTIGVMSDCDRFSVVIQFPAMAAHYSNRAGPVRTGKKTFLKVSILAKQPKPVLELKSLKGRMVCFT